MNVLLIEDDSFKANSLVEFLSASLPAIKVLTAPSLVDAIEAIDENEYDLVLIDMAIPSHPIISGGGAPMSLLTGGLEVLLELKSLGRRDPCVVITQYPEIEISGNFYSVQQAGFEIKNHLDCDVVACIEYSEGSGEWKNALGEVLSKYENINS